MENDEPRNPNDESMTNERPPHREHDNDPKFLDALHAIDDVYDPSVFTVADFEKLKRIRTETPITTRGRVLPTNEG